MKPKRADRDGAEQPRQSSRNPRIAGLSGILAKEHNSEVVIQSGD